MGKMGGRECAKHGWGEEEEAGVRSAGGNLERQV